MEAGSGISALPKGIIDKDSNLIEISSNLRWNFPVWALVYRDMFNLTKIKAFIDILRKAKDKPINFKL